MEGGKRPIVISDLVVTYNLGFVDDRSRILVNTTCAKDGQVFIRCTTNLFNKYSRVSELQALFNIAKADTQMICWALTRDSPLLKHKDVQLRIRFTAENVNAIEKAQGDFYKD